MSHTSNPILIGNTVELPDIDYDDSPVLTGDPLKDMVWWTEDLRAIPLGEMTRPHVRNALQWCIRRQSTEKFTRSKDGYTYQEWVTAFTVRLLDPSLP
jgi:hypothetical protein